MLVVRVLSSALICTALLLLTRFELSLCNNGPPWTHGCKLVISEVMTANPNPERIGKIQFIELQRVCDTPLRLTSLPSVEGFRIALISSEGQIFAFCELEGKLRLSEGQAFFVVGTDDVMPKPDMTFDSELCKFANDDKNVPYGRGTETNAVALMYKKSKPHFYYVQLTRYAGEVRSTSIDGLNEVKIRTAMQDILLFGTIRPMQFPQAFKRIQTSLTEPSAIITRTWGTSVDSHSFCRCTESSLPFQPTSWKFCPPTPGQLNRCEEGASVPSVEPLPTNTAGQACSSLIDESLSNIRQYQGDVLDVELITSDDVCHWFEWLPDNTNMRLSKYRCRLCLNAINNEVITERPGSSLRTSVTKPEGYVVLKANHGVSVKQQNADYIRSHMGNSIHKVAEQYAKVKTTFQNPVEVKEAMLLKGQPFHNYYNATMNLFRSVLKAVKIRVPFESFPELMDLQKKLGANLGSIHHTPDGYRSIVMHVSGLLHKNLVSYLKASDLEVAIICDGSVDIGRYDNLNVEIMLVTHDLKVKSYLYAYLPIGVSGRGVDLFQLLVHKFREDGIEEFMRQKIIAVSTDSAPVMKDTFFRSIQEWSTTKPYHQPCWIHRNELIMKAAYKQFPYIVEMDAALNSLYSFYHRSAKCTASLRNMQVEEGDTNFALQKLYKIRWIASKYKTTNIVVQHIVTIAKDLQAIALDEDFHADTRKEATLLHNRITDRDFLAHLAFFADVHEQFKIVSLSCQQSCKPIVGQCLVRDNLKKEVENLKHNSGDHLLLFLSKCKCDGNTCTLANFENAEAVSIDGIPLRKPPSGETEATMRKKLSLYREVYMDEILAQFDHYYLEYFPSAFEIFDPQQFEKFNVETAKPNIILLNRWFRFADSSEVSNMVGEYVVLIQSIMATDAYNQYKLLPVQDFWEKFSNLPEVSWTPRIRKILRYCLSVPVGSSECERNFSLYNREKTKARASLLPETAESLVRIRKNMNAEPSDEELLYYVKEWCKVHARSDDEARMPAQPKFNVEANGVPFPPLSF